MLWDQPFNYGIIDKTIVISEKPLGVDFKSMPIYFFTPPADPIKGVVKIHRSAIKWGNSYQQALYGKVDAKSNAKGEFEIGS